MRSTFHRFPHTAYLAWLGDGADRSLSTDIVRAEFVQAIEMHWRSKPLHRYRLSPEERSSSPWH